MSATGEDQGAPDSRVVEAAAPNRQPHALVVDDDAVFRLLAKEALVHLGWQVTEVESGEAALERYAALHPDLLLLDVELPGRDGYAVCAELRGTYGNLLAPVLMITGNHDDDESLARGFDAGATDFISKPLNWQLLGHRCRRMLESQRMVSELRDSRSTLANAQRIAHLGSYEWDVERDEVVWSDEIFHMLGIPEGQVQRERGLPLPGIQGQDREGLEACLRDAIQTFKPMSLDHRIRRADGIVRRVRHQAEVYRDENGEGVRVHGTILDVSEYSHAVEQLRYLANYDPLTGLTNRRLFRIQLDQTLERAAQTGERVALMFLDLDRFKRINDTLGHSAGDQLLQVVAERIRNRIRSTDAIGHGRSQDFLSSLSRVGGDEFTVLLSRLPRTDDAGTIARRILRSLPRPVQIEGNEVTVSASVGIAVYPDDGEDAETLLKHADAAMFHAKDLGGNLYQFYSSASNEASVRTLRLETYLRTALERDEFTLHYQPKVNLATRQVTGMEALLRWDNLELGMVSPGDFVSLAEESGMIVPIGDWVIQAACKQNKAWQDAGLPHIPVAVNVSSRQFTNKDVRRSVVRALEMSGLEPRYLELEITESAMMRGQEESARVLHELKELGVTVALDDFGTGYSSLSYLKRFPLDSLKIDRSFVLGLPNEPDAAGIINAIIAMAHVLGLKVVAEGVETEAQAAFLTGCQCDEMQGYVFSRPVPADEFAALLRARS